MWLSNRQTFLHVGLFSINIPSWSLELIWPSPSLWRWATHHQVRCPDRVLKVACSCWFQLRRLFQNAFLRHACFGCHIDWNELHDHPWLLSQWPCVKPLNMLSFWELVCVKFSIQITISISGKNTRCPFPWLLQLIVDPCMIISPQKGDYHVTGSLHLILLHFAPLLKHNLGKGQKDEMPLWDGYQVLTTWLMDWLNMWLSSPWLWMFWAKACIRWLMKKLWWNPLIVPKPSWNINGPWI